MTISTTVSTISYQGDGSTVAFTIPWLWFLDTDITIQKITGSTGAISTLVLNTDYSLSGVGTGGGTATLSVAPLGGSPADIVTIFLNPPITQLSHYVANAEFPSATVEQNFDRNVQISQRLQAQINKALRAPDADDNPDMTLPSAISRADKYVYFDANGDVGVSAGTTTDATLRADLAAGNSALVKNTGITYPQTAAESAAGVTPVNLYILPGNILRYGNNTIPGTTDMSTARQSAHNQFAAGGAPVYIPAGTYRCDTPLSVAATTTGAPLHIYGDGSRASIFTSALDIQQITTTGADSTHFVTSPQLNDIGFYNTFPVGANNTGATSFHVTIGNALSARIYNCYFKGTFNDTSSGTDAGITTNHGGLYLSWPGSFGAAFISNIYDCWFDHSQIAIDTSDCSVCSNYVWMPTGDYTIKCNAPNISVQNNPDIVCGQAHGGVWLTTNASLCKVQGNYFDGNGSPVLSGYGVYGDQQVTNQVSNNTFWQVGNAAIWTNNPSLWTISNNMFLNCGRNDTGVDCSDIVLNGIAFASQNIIANNIHYQTQTLSGGSKYAVYERNGGANPTANTISCDVSNDTAGQYATPAVKLAYPNSSSTIIGSYGHGIGSGQAFTGTLTGCTTSPTGSIKYTYDGNFIELIFPTITATSNTSACTITGLPAWLTPTSTQYAGVGLLQNNSVAEMGFFSIDNTGVITLQRTSLTVFTAAGTKGVSANSTFRFQRV